jgi:hypothetical protein
MRKLNVCHCGGLMSLALVILVLSLFVLILTTPKIASTWRRPTDFRLPPASSGALPITARVSILSPATCPPSVSPRPVQIEPDGIVSGIVTDSSGGVYIAHTGFVDASETSWADRMRTETTMPSWSCAFPTVIRAQRPPFWRATKPLARCRLQLVLQVDRLRRSSYYHRQ